MCPMPNYEPRHSLRDVQRAYILATADCGGNRTHTAKKLKISLRSLRMKLNNYAVERVSKSEGSIKLQQRHERRSGSRSRAKRGPRLPQATHAARHYAGIGIGKLTIGPVPHSLTLASYGI